MGYVAYAAGTLIAAVVIHSLVTRKNSTQHESISTSSPAFSLSVEEPKHDLQIEKEEEPEVSSVVSIQFSHDGDSDTEPSTPKSARSSRAATPQELESVTRQQSADYPPSPQPNGHTPKPKPAFEIMPPPPRPASSPNLAAQASKASTRPGAMPPPSSLPPSRARSPPRLKPATVSSLIPPARSSPIPPRANGTSSLAPPPSSASSLRVPVQKVLANTHMQPQSALQPTTSTQAPSKRSSRKIILAPGHSPLDWAALSNSTSSDALVKLRGQDATEHLGTFRLGRITPSMLKRQTGRKGKDAWTVYQGRVYNISAYLDFHPGGRDELMKGAGRSSDGLFAEVHPWVNWEGMLGNCLVGMLVGEEDGEAAADGNGAKENELDEMD